MENTGRRVCPQGGSARPRIVLGRLAVGLCIGVSIGWMLWWANVAQKGGTVAQALRGEVEDALGVLQGLITIGVLAGGTVGLLHGLWMADKRAR